MLSFSLTFLFFGALSVVPVFAYVFSDYDYETSENKTTTLATGGEFCIPAPLGGVEWIIAQRDSDYGWKGETHRAIIALAINNWKQFASAEAIRQMELQLDVEVTKNLLRNSSVPVHPNDLALYIHALIATRRNPHDFYGIDLVSKLLKIVDTSRFEVHPFLLLAICNSNAASHNHLHIANSILRNRLSNRRNAADYLALALNAYECMKTLDYEVDEALINEAQAVLLTYQRGDGSFGNVYTTALIVQAMASAQPVIDWDKEAALSFLQRQSTVDVNMVSTYLIQLALNSENYPFIKNLHPDLPIGPVIVEQDEGHFIQYTLRAAKRPDVYFTITLKVAKNSSFFDVMDLSAKHDSKFNFEYYTDNKERPNVYSISGVPNDAEENLYWRLCCQSEVDHNRHTSVLSTLRSSPAEITPKSRDHMIYWYRDSDCEDENPRIQNPRGNN